jgi:hypothetical protein
MTTKWFNNNFLFQIYFAINITNYNYRKHKLSRQTNSENPENLPTSRIYFHNKTHLGLLQFENTFAKSEKSKETQLIVID